MKKYRDHLKALLTITGVLGVQSRGLACDACKAQQPKFLQGITHGAGPSNNWDYVVVSIMVIITVYSFYAMVRCLAKPAEQNHEYIKNAVLNT